MDKRLNSVNYPVPMILEFPQYLLDDGCSHSTLHVYIVAISSHHDLVDSGTVGSHRFVTLYRRGALRSDPPRVGSALLESPSM